MFFKLSEIKEITDSWWQYHKIVFNSLKMRSLAHHARISGKPAPSGLEFTLYHSMAAVPQPVWDECNRNGDVFLSTAYLSALEQAPPANMQFRYVVFSDQGRPAAIGYFQILELNPRLHRPAENPGAPGKKDVFGRFHEKVADHLSHHLLVCGNALLSGEHGYAFAGPTESQVLQALAEAAYAIRKSTGNHIDVTLFKDFYNRNHRPTDTLSRFGYYPFDAGPNMVISLRPHWLAFDDYLKQMRPKYAKRVKDAVKKGMPIQRRTLSLAVMIAQKNRLFELYCEVVNKIKIKLFYLSPEYFVELKRKLGDRFVCDAYYAGETMIGFTTRIFNGSSLEGYTHGLKYEQNKSYEIYRNFMLDDIHAALAARCSHINTGRTSIAMKSSLGAAPDSMTCYLRFSGKFANQLIKPLFYFIKPTKEYCRNPFEE